MFFSTADWVGVSDFCLYQVQDLRSGCGRPRNPEGKHKKVRTALTFSTFRWVGDGDSVVA